MSSAMFVTGGSGFLGQRLIAMLVEAGHEVRALARSSTAAEAVQRVGATAVRGDLESHDSLKSGMAGCQIVYHSAAKAEVFGSSYLACSIHILK